MFRRHPDTDIVYGDWQRLEADAINRFVPAEMISRTFGDVDPDPEIAFMLGMWCPTGAYLFRRSIVERILPWKEWLPVIQDARFVWDAAEAGAVWLHDRSVAVLYRQHREGSISTRSRRAFLEDRERHLDDIAARWRERGLFADNHKRAWVKACEELAVEWFAFDREGFRRLRDKLLAIDPEFRLTSRKQRLFASFFGWESTLSLGESMRSMRRRLDNARSRAPRVLYIQYSNPAAYPPVEHGSRILADAGCEVVLMGAASSGTESFRPSAHPRIRFRLWNYRRPGWMQKLHYLAFCTAAVMRAIRLRARWIYASDAFAAPIGCWLYRLGFRVVYHEHDEPEQVARTFFQRWIGRQRLTLARMADFCIVPNEARAQRLRSASGMTRPVFTVMNCPQRNEARSADHSGEKFVFFYHGTIVPARLPLALIRALSRLPDPVVLRIAGYETIGHLGHLQSLLDEAERLGIGGRVEVVGPVAMRADLLNECRRAHVGISFMPMRTDDANERTMAGASNKAFDYLACGLPLLVSDLPDWNAMFVDAGYAKSCDPGDEDSIARALQWFVDHANEASAMGAAGRQRVLDDWNYERQFISVAARILADV
jgi:glycosyltransferase involved in cell wall biosynthesis